MFFFMVRGQLNSYVKEKEDNSLYFYKAEGEVSYNSEANIELTEIKLIINNNMVKEEKSPSKINGHFGQCK